MSFPGISGAGGGGGASTAGMSDQEAAMVKAVRAKLQYISSYQIADRLATADARSHGELSFQDSSIWRYGICIRGSFRAVYVECKSYTDPHPAHAELLTTSAGSR